MPRSKHPEAYGPELGMVKDYVMGKGKEFRMRFPTRPLATRYRMDWYGWITALESSGRGREAQQARQIMVKMEQVVSGDAENPAAHGNITVTEYCLDCGRTKRSNINGRHREETGWT